MFQATMSNSTLSEEASLSSFNPLILQNTTTHVITSPQQQQLPPKKVKKKRNLPGNPDPDAEVIALSPKSLLATNRFICEICNKGFQRDQNLQLHRRGHNLPWKLKQRNSKDVVRKKAYVCPEPSCVHHHPSRALGDLTGIKKHFCRKHGEKKYKCEKCSKIYAVQSDCKAHSKTCGTREYKCDCGTLFSRKDSFITHRAFCDALAEESARRLSTNNPFTNPNNIHPSPPPPPPPPFSTLPTTSHHPNNHPSPLFPFSISLSPNSPWDPPPPQNPNNNNPSIQIKSENNHHHFSPPPTSAFFQPPPFTTAATSAHFLSATALLQKAATMGAMTTTAAAATLQQNHQAHQAMMAGFDELAALSSFRHVEPVTTTSATTDHNHIHHYQYHDHQYNVNPMGLVATWKKSNELGLTRDFLGLTTAGGGGGDHQGFDNDDDEVAMVGDMLKFTGGLQYGMTAAYDCDNSLKQPAQPVIHHPHHHHQVEGFGFVTAEPPATAASETRWG